MQTLRIEIVPALEDNYAYLLRDAGSGKTACVDTPDAAPILKALETLGWKLDYILNTHHHWDHTQGNLEIQKATGCVIAGFGEDAARIPGIGLRLEDGGVFVLGESAARVIHIPGHTLGHVCYWFEAARAVFTGDTLFSMGCGRLFEGEPAMMLQSLAKLTALPEDTRIYCGHEYTLKNARFAHTLEPENAALQRRIRKVEALREAGKPSIPVTLGVEKATNPFLRAASKELRHSLQMEGASDVEVFAEIRARRNNF